MADLAAAMERAQSRAAVLQSLQNSYGSEAKVPPSVANSSKNLNGKGGTDQSNRNNGTNDKNTMNEVIDVLVETISDPSMRAKQFFKDALRGKAIVVENVKAQLDASKASKRIELYDL